MICESPVPRSINVSAKELTSYQAVSRHESVLKSFDSILHQHTNRVVRSFASDVEIQSISFSSLKEVAGSLLEMNKEVVRIILDSKEDIWKNQSMVPLVELYFDSSANALDFCNSLEYCLQKVKTRQLMTINLAVKQFEEEMISGKTVESDKKFKKTFEELKKFKETENPFQKDFFDKFDNVYEQQVVLLQKLRTEKRTLDEKLKHVKVWRKVSNLVFATAFVSVLILSVVAAAVSAPPVVAALAGALSVPAGSVGKWCDTLWKKYEKAVKGETEIITSMNFAAYITMKDVENIRVLAEKIEIQMLSLKQKAKLAIQEEEEEKMVRLTTEEIKKQLRVFEETLGEIHLQVDKVSSFITKSRTVILQRIIGYSNSSPGPQGLSWFCCA